MSKFTFRLEKLLEYRREQEKIVETTYLETRARRISCEQDIEGTQRTRALALSNSPSTVSSYRSLDSYLERISDEARALASSLSVLLDEEEKARQAWLKAHQETEAIEKLRESEKAAWQYKENRREQNEMDEWAVMRRAA